MTPTQPTAEQLEVTLNERERIAIEWLQCELEDREKWLSKCQREVAAFTAMNKPAFKDTFLLNWQDCAESAARRLEIYRTLTDIVRDRNEWREQHENLLSVRRSDLQATEARMAAAVEWQDIATAPKDGTPVDLWCINHLKWDKRGERVVNRKWGPCINIWQREDEGWGLSEDMEPTHWLPLPAPPKASEEQEPRSE